MKSSCVTDKIKLPFKTKKTVLALGAETKNSICFLEGGNAYLSLVHQDLKNPQDYLAFEKCVKYWLKNNPSVIACDLHPEYESSKYAQRVTHDAKHMTLKTIQHHHAHIASCMVENELKNKKVIGVAFDGTGLGADGKIWGAEFLICDYHKFIRAAHFKEIPLLGGEMAIRQPRRLVFSWLYPVYKQRLKILFRHFSQQEFKVLEQLYLKEINSPRASSTGRFFDAAGSIILDKPDAKYEGELPIQLEKTAYTAKNKALSSGCKFKIIRGRPYLIDPTVALKNILCEVRSGKSRAELAYKFHLSVAHCIKDICRALRKDAKIDTVVLSGGVFQNKLLLSAAEDLLAEEKFNVVTHKRFSASDSSLSLGQAVIALYGGI